MDFESYLISKRIESARFKSAEPELWQSWKDDFDQMHSNSFTVQKLNLINPIRRKYQLIVVEPPKTAAPSISKTPSSPVVKPVVKAAGAGIDVAQTLATASDGPLGGPESPAPVVPSPIDASTPSTSTPDVATQQRESNNEQSNTADLINNEEQVSETPKPAVRPAKPVIPRPVIKPKPKTN